MQIFSKKTEMNLVPTEGISDLSIIKKLPPLIKAYLRLGAKIGDGAVVDREGNVWCAFWGASQVICLSSDGGIVQRVWLYWRTGH